MTNLVTRGARVALRPALQVRRQWRTHRTAGRILESIDAPRPSSAAATLPERLTVVVTHRVSDENRLRLLSAVVGRLSEQLGPSGIAVDVVDASPPDMRSRTRVLWEQSGVSLQYEARDEPMAVSLRRVLDRLRTRYFYLQFDDMLTVGLTPERLGSACDVLDLTGSINAPVAFLRPVRTQLDQPARTVDLITHECRPSGALRFFAGEPTIPIARVQSGGTEYAVVRNPTYGFFVNHVVASAADYGRRLGWYMDRRRTTSVHEVELAAAPKLVGPYWTHLLVPLAELAVLDLDFAHTDAAVRADLPENLRLLEAVEQTYAFRCAGR